MPQKKYMYSIFEILFQDSQTPLHSVINQGRVGVQFLDVWIICLLIVKIWKYWESQKGVSPWPETGLDSKPITIIIFCKKGGTHL